MRFFITILLIILLIRLIAPSAIRFFFFVFVPWLINRSMKRRMSNYTRKPKTPEGTITINHVPDQKQGSEKDKFEGDYTDYEEVK